MVRQESADAGLLERNLVAVAHLLARAAFCHELLDFFRGTARRLVAHRIVGEDNFFAESRNAACLAVAPFAVRHRCGIRVECLFPFAAQVLLCRACVNKVPREDFVLVAFAVDPVCVVAAFFPNLEPLVKVKTVAVAFKDDALLVGGVNDWTEAAVATAVDCFQETCFPGRPVDFHVRVLEELFAHVADVPECCFFVHKRSPLQARKRLRDENADTHCNLNAAIVLAPDFHEIEDELAERLHVI